MCIKYQYLVYQYYISDKLTPYPKKDFFRIFQKSLTSTECLRDHHILRCGHLNIGIAAFHELHLRVRHLLHHHGVICDMAAVCSWHKHLLIGAVDQLEAECLWSLDLP